MNLAIKRQIIMQRKSARYPTTKIKKAAITWSAESYVVRKLIDDLLADCVRASHEVHLDVDKCKPPFNLDPAKTDVCPLMNTFEFWLNIRGHAMMGTSHADQKAR
jgi:hypothetical protein